MCDSNCVNLIDLSLEDVVPDNNLAIKSESEMLLTVSSPHFVQSSYCKLDSLDNNPFDRVQNMTDLLDDFFEDVEKEDCLKSQQTYVGSGEVKLGKLLSLSDDNIPDQENIPATSSEELSDLRSLDLESPLNDPTLKSSLEMSSSTKLRKSTGYRKRLLKLRLSNAAYNSPNLGRQSIDYEDILDTPVSSMFSKAAEFGEFSLAAESPLKLVQDEELISEEIQNLVDSEQNFEADLEMLKIPILNNLPSSALDKISIKFAEDSSELVNSSCGRFQNTLPNLEAIKYKLKSNADEIRNEHDLEVSSLIKNLKMLISTGEMLDNKKQKAYDLLDSLSSSLKSSNTEEIKTSLNLDLPPQSIKRQGTFDLDLQKKMETKAISNDDNQLLLQDIPTCMVSSSATYDSETPSDKQHFNLPEIAPLSPKTSPIPGCYQNVNAKHGEKNFHNDVNDIMEQLSNILINISADNQTNCPNPTVIVVMNTTTQLNNSNNHSNQNLVETKSRSAFVANYFENSIDSSADLRKIDEVSRRRSQSLSIYDKSKIVHLPLQTPAQDCSILEQHTVKLNESSPTITTTPPHDKKMPEFKTPSQLRRNSYSSGTPYTAQIGLRRAGYGNMAWRSWCSAEPDSVDISIASEIIVKILLRVEKKYPMKIYKTQTLDAHQEAEKQTAVRPMPMPANNFLTFKPDVKKKIKHTTESIMKSCGPLRAIIPVKKVATMMKISPPTPKENKSEISLPTTPLQSKRNSKMGDVGYPKACSTPAATPLNRIMRSVNKPRYSYTTNTNSSLTDTAISATLKKRTITEFKSKSTLKQRGTFSGLGATALPSKAVAGSSRLSVSVGARVSKTPLKTPTLNTATVKTTSRLSSRLSVGGSLLSAKSKENLRP